MSQPPPERLVGAEPHPGDGSDRALRPLSFDQFIGQAQLCENLKIFVEAARLRAAALDHVLLFGSPGLGKTTLSQIIARELGVNFKATAGPVLSKAGDLAALLTQLRPRDILFIDEIHRLSPAIEEILYPAMEDYKLDLIIGEGPAARSVRLDLPPFTLVGATTRSGLLSAPLRDRFGIPLNLVFYTPAELSQIVMGAAQCLSLNIDLDGVNEIAVRARGTPRIALRLLRRVADFSLVQGHTRVEQSHVDFALQQLAVDQLGLDATDRRYLQHISQHFSGGPVGIETLAAALAEQRDTLEEIVEPYLIQQGFIQRTPRGRVLGALAYRHLGLPVPVEKE